MNKNMIIVLGGALFVAIFAALLVQSGLSSDKEEVQEAQIQILVASKNVTVGTKVTSSNMTWKQWPEKTKFPGAIVRKGDQDVTEALKGRALRSIEAGEPITQSSIVKETRGNFIAASLSEGMRAFAIEVSAETAAGGFVSPGDYIDIILTHRVRLPNDDDVQEAAQRLISQTASETLVEGIKVLAIDQDSKPTDEAAKFKTITLEVTPHQSEVLALGSELGTLSIALRKLGEDKVVEGEKDRPFVTDNTSSRIIQEVMKKMSGPGQRAQVRLYSGNQASNVEVRNPIAQEDGVTQ